MALEVRKFQVLQNKLEDRNLFKTVIKNVDDVNVLSELEKKRKVETQEIVNKVKDIFEFLNRISNAFQEDNLNSLYTDLNCLKTDLIGILQKNKNLKAKIKTNLEILQKQEDELYEEIETFDEKCRNWDKPTRDVLLKMAKNQSIIKITNDSGNSINDGEISLKHEADFKYIKTKKRVQPKKAFEFHAKKCEVKAKAIENSTQNNQTIQNKKPQIKLTPEERLNIKKSIEKWKNQINLNKTMKQLETEIQTINEQKHKQTQANRMIKQFQVQDNIFLTKRKINRKIDKQTSIVSVNNSNSISKRNPERVFQPTKVWVQKITQKKSNSEEGYLIPYISDIRRISKLRVPEWRKNPTNQVKV